MMSRISPRCTLPLFLALIAACSGAGGRSARVDRPERLDGRWSVALRLEEPIRLHGDTAAAGTVRGEIALIDDPAARPAPGLGGNSTHYGVYAADFARFGFAAGAARVPTAVARLLDADSVEIALDPEAGHAVMLAGRLAGDSVAGHWRYVSGRSAAAAGRFVMRRR